MIYTNEKTDVRPDDRTADTSILHRELILPALDDSSPELYSLKKPAGSESSRIIVAASTERFIFVFIRAIRRADIEFTNSLLTETQTMKVIYTITEV